MDGAPLVEVDPHQLLSVTIKGIKGFVFHVLFHCNYKYIKYRLVSCQP